MTHAPDRDRVPRSATRRARRRRTASVGAAPGTVVYSENKLELIRYESRTDERRAVPILVVSAVINRPSILDFQPDRSVVGQFLDRGFDVYLLDWGEPTALDAGLGLDDYVTRYLANCVDAVVERNGADAVHLFGYCSGATLSVIFAALYPDRVRTLGLLAPLLNFDVDGGLFDLWRTAAPDDPRRLTEVVGNAPGEWLGAGFALADPVEYYLARYLRLADHVGDGTALSQALGRVRWGLDSVDVAGALYGDFLIDLYRENRLIEGRLSVGGRRVDLSVLTMPVLAVLGTDDRFVPAAASRPFLELIPSPDTTVIEFPTGHIGLSIDDRSHAALWPSVCDWFAARSDA